MQLFNRRGYTIDQTILIVAIIAILITLVIITLGWTLLSRTSGSKLGTFTDQISQAVNTYYGTVHNFPGAMVDLDGQGLIKFRNAGSLTAPDYRHDIGGSGGVVSMLSTAMTAAQAADVGGVAGNYLITTFTEVPAAEANEADKGVDGASGAKGHLVINDGTGDCSAANLLANAAKKATKTTTVCFIGQRVS